MDIAVFVGMAGAMATILFSLLAYQRGSKKDHTDEGKNSGVILSDIGYIKAGVDDLKRDQKDTRTEVNHLTERVVAVEASSKQAHHRIDELKGKD